MVHHNLGPMVGWCAVCTTTSDQWWDGAMVQHNLRPMVGWCAVVEWCTCGCQTPEARGCAAPAHGEHTCEHTCEHMPCSPENTCIRQGLLSPSSFHLSVPIGEHTHEMRVACPFVFARTPLYARTHPPRALFLSSH